MEGPQAAPDHTLSATNANANANANANRTAAAAAAARNCRQGASTAAAGAVVDAVVGVVAVASAPHKKGVCAECDAIYAPCPPFTACTQRDRRPERRQP